jgi:hypothetical protein
VLNCLGIQRLRQRWDKDEQTFARIVSIPTADKMAGSHTETYSCTRGLLWLVRFDSLYLILPALLHLYRAVYLGNHLTPRISPKKSIVLSFWRRNRPGRGRRYSRDYGGQATLVIHTSLES